MAEVVAMAVFQGSTGLSEDRYVNTFHFDSSLDYALDSPNIAERLIAFYNNIHSLAPPIGSWLAPRILRSESEIRTYDLDQPGPGRTPTIYPFTLVSPATTSGGLPEEIALCLTYHGTPPITPRRRGRIYLGPFTVAALGDTSVAAAEPVPNPALVASINLAAQYLNYGDDETFIQLQPRWSIRSAGARVPRPNTDAPLGALLPVTNTPVFGGWVDNAWDTQRRRGRRATGRVLWGDTI